MRPRYYTLEGHKTVPCHSLMEWAKWFEASGKGRIVAQAEIGEARVSTVFLGMDHNWYGAGEPLLFETMIFGGPHNDYQARCSTWEQAEGMHSQALKLVKRGLFNVVKCSGKVAGTTEGK